MHVFPVAQSGPKRPGQHSLSGGQKSNFGSRSQALFLLEMGNFHRKSFKISNLQNSLMSRPPEDSRGRGFPPDFLQGRAKIGAFGGVGHLHKLFTQASPSGAACGARIEIRGPFAQEKMAKSSQENLLRKRQIFLTLPLIKTPPCPAMDRSNLEPRGKSSDRKANRSRA